MLNIFWDTNNLYKYQDKQPMATDSQEEKQKYLDYTLVYFYKGHNSLVFVLKNLAGWENVNSQTQPECSSPRNVCSHSWDQRGIESSSMVMERELMEGLWVTFQVYTLSLSQPWVLGLRMIEVCPSTSSSDMMAFIIWSEVLPVSEATLVNLQGFVVLWLSPTKGAETI